MRKNFFIKTTLLAACTLPAASGAMTVDHQEFDASLLAPFRADASGGREVTLYFAQQAGRVRWQLDLLAPRADTVLRQWRGERLLGEAGQPAVVTLHWHESAATPAGIYRLRLRASLDGAQDTEQIWPVAIGPAPAATPAFAPSAAAPLAEAARYDIYLGNLHSQTGHSDGGGALGQCIGAQQPQSSPLGPTDAYAYALAHHLDFLMTSEHNHMYDGSDGTNANADAAAVRALYQNGLHQATSWNLAHDGFLALYGQEWGVISNGGHLNILNSDRLLGWERNARGALLADTGTPKSDYASLYTLMRGRGWVGQFNHPQRDQFAIAGQPLAWTADGDQAMLLCEVVNSNAFSSSTDESEPRRSNFEAGCNALLEAGFHLAFSSNQDNHCANWGASYSNRTAVLLPGGVPLTTDNFLDALKARRVYATMDKQAQLIFTANGHLMGERFSNRGKLTLKASYRSKNGRSATAVTIFQGVPGRNGVVTALSDKARSVVTPKQGEHFYYARVTQDDGKMLWSAPVWVTQLPRPIVR